MRSGLAITIPELAPETQAPAEPMLHRRSVKAMGDSVAMNESTDRFNNCASRSWRTLLGPGKPSTVCKARLLMTKKAVTEFIAQWVIDVRLKLLKGTGDEKMG